MRLRVALVPTGGLDARARFADLLTKSLPRHVSLVDAGPGAATLSYALSEPTRTHRVTRSVRTKTVLAGKATAKPNPACAEAK